MKKISDQKNIDLYYKFIFEKIKEAYLHYKTKEEETKGESFYKIKDFIATLLLKFEHRKHLTFLIYGVSQIIYKPLFTIKNSVNHGQIGEIFFEFRDRLMIIPTMCI